MTALFLVCAALGGTLLICQAALALFGLGFHDADVDAGHGADHAGGGDGPHAETADHHGAGGSDSADHGAAGHASFVPAWIFGLLSFRAVVAGMAFLGLAGLAAQAAEARWPVVLLVALGAGLTAAYTVSGVMRWLIRQRASGTVEIARTLGCEATVYLRVPPRNSGLGKVQLNVQNRTMEYLASTAGEELATGSRVLVVDIVDPQTLAVEPVSVPLERSNHV